MAHLAKSSAKSVVQAPIQRLSLPDALPIAESARSLQRQRQMKRDLTEHTSRPARIQRQQVQPALQAAQLHTGEIQRLGSEQIGIQRAMTEMGSISEDAISGALQRQQAAAQPAAPPLKPQSVGDWVTVMRCQAKQHQGRQISSRENMQYTALQRQVAQTIAQNFRRDTQSPAARYAEYGGHLASLQRHPASAPVAQVAMSLTPAGERIALQRAVDEALQRYAVQEAQDQQALQYHSLQRKLAEVEQEATKPVFQRIQARRGSGNPLPEGVRRHLEQGLNHDLSAVRIHDDAEADKLAKGVNAIAFTTGTDIFSSRKIQPQYADRAGIAGARSHAHRAAKQRTGWERH